MIQVPGTPIVHPDAAKKSCIRHALCDTPSGRGLEGRRVVWSLEPVGPTVERTRAVVVELGPSLDGAW